MSAARIVPNPIQLSDAEMTQTQQAARVLAHLAGQNKAIHLQTAEAEGNRQEVFALPATAIRLLSDMLSQMAAGHMVTILPVHAELTTQQAADMLNVSRPFLIGLLEQGRLPFHKAGTHRRVRLADLQDYKHRTHAARREALDAMARQGQELGLADCRIDAKSAVTRNIVTP